MSPLWIRFLLSYNLGSHNALQGAAYDLWVERSFSSLPTLYEPIGSHQRAGWNRISCGSGYFRNPRFTLSHVVFGRFWKPPDSRSFGKGQETALSIAVLETATKLPYLQRFWKLPTRFETALSVAVLETAQQIRICLIFSSFGNCLADLKITALYVAVFETARQLRDNSLICLFKEVGRRFRRDQFECESDLHKFQATRERENPWRGISSFERCLHTDERSSSRFGWIPIEARLLLSCVRATFKPTKRQSRIGASLDDKLFRCIDILRVKR